MTCKIYQYKFSFNGVLTAFLHRLYPIPPLTRTIKGADISGLGRGAIIGADSSAHYRCCS